jgi:hypothetical protein
MLWDAMMIASCSGCDKLLSKTWLATIDRNGVEDVRKRKELRSRKGRRPRG